MKEKIILATLDLASKYGLGSLSMSQIAEAVGIKKPSLYNHFTSKEELIDEMYNYLRELSKKGVDTKMDYDKFRALDAATILNGAVCNYLRMVKSDQMNMFYRVIYAERSINPNAAKILIDETDKMVAATKDLLAFLDKTEKLHIDDVDMAATSFAMNVHALIEYQLDCEMTGKSFSNRSIEKYIKWFCGQYK